MAKIGSRAKSVDRWDRRLARQAASGQTVARFCAGEGISVAAFYYQRRKRRGRFGHRAPKTHGVCKTHEVAETHGVPERHGALDSHRVSARHGKSAAVSPEGGRTGRTTKTVAEGDRVATPSLFRQLRVTSDSLVSDRIKVRLPGGVELSFARDPDLVRQVLDQLLSSACSPSRDRSC